MQCSINPVQIEMWAIGRLIPYARNPRKNDQAVDRMCASIREFGFKIPCLVRSNGELVGLITKSAAKVLFYFLSIGALLQAGLADQIHTPLQNGTERSRARRFLARRQRTLFRGMTASALRILSGRQPKRANDTSGRSATC